MNGPTRLLVPGTHSPKHDLVSPVAGFDRPDQAIQAHICDTVGLLLLFLFLLPSSLSSLLLVVVVVSYVSNKIRPNIPASGRVHLPLPY